jgi:hypothetical protein
MTAGRAVAAGTAVAAETAAGEKLGQLQKENSWETSYSRRKEYFSQEILNILYGELFQLLCITAISNNDSRNF